MENYLKVIDKNLNDELNNINFSFSFKDYNDSYRIMLNNEYKPLLSFMYPLFCMTYLSKVYIYNISEKTKDDLNDNLEKDGNLTLMNIIEILVKNNHKLLLSSMEKAYGTTRSEILNGSVTWYLYVGK